MKYLFAALLLCAVGAPVQAQGPVEFFGNKAKELWHSHVEAFGILRGALVDTADIAAELAATKVELAAALAEAKNMSEGFAAAEQQRRTLRVDYAEKDAALAEMEEEIANRERRIQKWAEKAQKALRESALKSDELKNLQAKFREVDAERDALLSENITLADEKTALRREVNLLHDNLQKVIKPVTYWPTTILDYKGKDGCPKGRAWWMQIGNEKQWIYITNYMPQPVSAQCY